MSEPGTIHQLQRQPVTGTREAASELAREELAACRRRFGRGFIHHERYDEPDLEWWKITLARDDRSEIWTTVMWKGGGR